MEKYDQHRAIIWIALATPHVPLRIAYRRVYVLSTFAAPSHDVRGGATAEPRTHGDFVIKSSSIIIQHLPFSFRALPFSPTAPLTATDDGCWRLFPRQGETP